MEMRCSLLVVVSTALLLLRLSVVMVTAGGAREADQHGRRGSALQDEKTFCSWRCLMFTLQWPGGFCLSLNNQSLCRIPPSVNGWTIHGLWPQTQSCCRCWPMFPSDVQELEEELSEEWPSLLKSRTSFTFWREEWQKHGSTAACVEGLNSPLRYFQICLKLRAQLDIQRFLEDAGITPSCDQPYQVEDVRRVLAPHLGDHPEIQCITDEQGRQVWFQVKIPLSRNLTVGCDSHAEAGGGFWEKSALDSSTSPGHPCPSKEPFYYVPIEHQQPFRPCG
ncbi:ribonuclease T2-like [Salarias fasciatus]|uniref:Ribonuclease Oy-like n=1 Tax=Salarias fasciatus TaxID=181472 RepID=A0A672H7J1_SALFA|nr:ribonuclease Oy-like [Salarias fasciatus]